MITDSAHTWRLSQFLSGINRYRLDDPAFQRQVVLILIACGYTGGHVRLVRDTFERVFMELADAVDRALYSEGVTRDAAQKSAGI